MFSPNSDVSFAILFTTDQDSSKVTVGTWNANYDELYFTQVSLDPGFSMSSNNFMSWPNNVYPKMAGVGSDTAGNPILYVFGFYKGCCDLDLVSSVYVESLEAGTHTLYAAPTSSYRLNMVTMGPCQTFSNGLMVTEINVSSTAYSLSCGRCIDLSSSAFTVAFGPDPFSVSQTVTFSDGQSVTFLEGGSSSSNFLSYGLGLCPENSPTYRLMGGLPADTTV